MEPIGEGGEGDRSDQDIHRAGGEGPRLEILEAELGVVSGRFAPWPPDHKLLSEARAWQGLRIDPDRLRARRRHGGIGEGGFDPAARLVLAAARPQSAPTVNGLWIVNSKDDRGDELTAEGGARVDVEGAKSLEQKSEPDLVGRLDPKLDETVDQANRDIALVLLAHPFGKIGAEPGGLLDRVSRIGRRGLRIEPDRWGAQMLLGDEVDRQKTLGLSGSPWHFSHLNRVEISARFTVLSNAACGQTGIDSLHQGRPGAAPCAGLISPLARYWHFSRGVFYVLQGVEEFDRG